MNKTIKKILIVFGFFIISVLLAQNKSYAANVLLCTIENGSFSGTTEKVLEKLGDWYDYNQSEIYNPLYLGQDFDKISLQATESGKGYKLKIGNEDSTITDARGTLSYKKLKTLGCPYGSEEEFEDAFDEEDSVTWSTILKVKVTYEKTTGILNSGVKLTFTITGTIADGTDINYRDSDIIEIETIAEVFHDFLETVQGAVDTLYDIVDGVADAYNWVKKFKSNAVGTIVNLILDGIMNIFGDGPQIMINYVQTVVDETSDDGVLLYTTEDLEADGAGGTLYGIGHRDKYTNVEIYDDKDDFGHADVEIRDVDGDANSDDASDDDEDYDGKGYKFEDNLIPITAVDIYTMSTNKVSFLDVNFFTEDTAGGRSNVWKEIRKLVSKAILACIYIAALILITALIWYGVKIVMNSFSPGKKAEGKEGLNRFVTGVTMLVGSIVIMAISIYSYQAVGISENSTTDTSDPEYWEFPIRVNVTITAKTWWDKLTIRDQYYSFSTTITGYMRFMAQIENPDRFVEKAGYVIAYVILANMNVIIFVIMVFRMLAMWILAMVGPILATLYAITKNDKMLNRYKTWAICYLILGFIQLFFAIAYWIMMETMGFN